MGKEKAREIIYTACKDCSVVYRHRADNRSGRCKVCRSKHAVALQKTRKKPMTEAEIEAHLEAGDRKTWNLGAHW